MTPTDAAARERAEQVIRQAMYEGVLPSMGKDKAEFITRASHVLVTFATHEAERARREERAEFNALLDKWEAAYPEAVFPPFTAVDHPHVSPDRIAAEMGRHMARELRKQLAGPPASAPEARCFPACYDDDRCSYPKCTATAPEGETRCCDGACRTD